MEHVQVDGLKTDERDPSFANWSVLPPRSLVIFVHGWGGGRLETWKPLDTFIRTHASQFTPHDLIFYSYRSREQLIPTSANKFHHFIDEFLKNPTTAINASAGITLRTGPTSYERIFFVCHSLGAIVVRQALLDFPLRKQTTPTWLKSSRLILFAPAHKGAVATEIAALLFSTIGRFATPVMGTIKHFRWKSLIDIERTSDFLQRLEKDSIDHVTAVPDASYARAKLVLWAESDSVVVRLNFGLDPPAEEIEDTNHTSICKPDLPSRKAYTYLTTQLQDPS